MFHKCIPIEDVHTYVVGSVSEFRARREVAKATASGGPGPLPPVLDSAWDIVRTAAPRAPTMGEVFGQAA